MYKSFQNGIQSFFINSSKILTYAKENLKTPYSKQLKRMFKKNIFSLFKKKKQSTKFWIETILFALLLFSSLSCADKSWQDLGDSCILTSENPPLRRVINYTDHYLCERELPPRTAPNPRTRFQTYED